MKRRNPYKTWNPWMRCWSPLNEFVPGRRTMCDRSIAVDYDPCICAGALCCVRNRCFCYSARSRCSRRPSKSRGTGFIERGGACCFGCGRTCCCERGSTASGSICCTAARSRHHLCQYSSGDSGIDQRGIADSRDARGIGTVVDHRPADWIDTDPDDAHVCDAVCAPADRLPFFAPGAGTADHAVQPDAHRAVAGAHVFSDAAGRRPDLPEFDHPGAVRADYRDGSAEPRRSPDAEVYVALRAREGCCAVYRAGKRTTSQLDGRFVNAGVVAGLYLVRVKGRFSNRHGFVSAIFDCRYGCGFDYYFGGHAAVAAGRYFHSAQVAAVPDGRWLAPLDQFIDEE